MCSHVYELWIFVTDESGSDSEGAESTSSSYSSLSDFVTDMVNSEIDGESPGQLVVITLQVVGSNILLVINQTLVRVAASCVCFN